MTRTSSRMARAGSILGVRPRTRPPRRIDLSSPAYGGTVVRVRGTVADRRDCPSAPVVQGIR
jgi:hypothetical protein